jgi:tetratricopeptide (TPR) repeat protein
MVAGVLLSLIGLTIGGWAYLASVALTTGQLTADVALSAYDRADYEDARTIVGHMLTGGQLAGNDYGAPLFVLGAIKIRDAENQAVPERRRVEYLIASRYLTEARAYGLPADREAQGSFLLGQSLVESGQFEEGISVLNELIASPGFNDAPLQAQSQQLLAETCLMTPHPKLDEALEHNDKLIAIEQLSEEQHTAAFVQRALCLARLDRYEEAQQALASVGANPTNTGLLALTSATILLDEVDAAIRKVPASQRSLTAAAMQDKVAAALAKLEEARTLDQQKSKVSQQATYQLARGLALKGDTDAALKQFLRTRQLYADSLESLAAGMGEADVLRAPKGRLRGGGARLSTCTRRVRGNPRVSQSRPAGREHARTNAGRAERLFGTATLRRGAQHSRSLHTAVRSN